jgi:DNA polymerase
LISLDYETYSEVDLTKVGLDAYTSHPSFEVLMAAYRIDGGPLQHWQPHERPVPAEFEDALLDPAEQKWGFNSQFERVVTRRGLNIPTPVQGWRCTQVLSYMQSFMGGLAEVGAAIGLPLKDPEGRRLIRLFTMPQRITRNQPHRRRDWRTDPEDWDKFIHYNMQDVVAEESIAQRLAPYPVLEDEWRLYELDQIVNDRGMPLDLQYARNLVELSDRRRAELVDEMARITGIANPIRSRSFCRG